MKYRNAIFLSLAAGSALVILAGAAVSGYGASALHAESAGFDALVYQMSSSDPCGDDMR